MKPHVANREREIELAALRRRRVPAGVGHQEAMKKYGASTLEHVAEKIEQKKRNSCSAVRI
ncbi:hypothetical protein Pcac1_g12526 [Phytophthora cactorum]|nr:hypothetical protein Pcac1_g12526 [Phytophthora cactorum]KAG2905915.1 hypothetical protein PC114_g11347 [Phytophthora cactorum]KAG4053767.1 hypothetical protein PC123_g11092 [Phytophthora cactorum]